MRRSRWRIVRWRAFLVAAVMLAGSGCAAGSGHDPLGGFARGGGCYPTPDAAGRPLPYSLGDVSAAPGTHQAWMLGGTPLGLGPYSRQYLLHVSGRNWTKSLTFRRDVHPAGVSAVSGLSTWIWGYQGRYLVDWQKDRPFLEQLTTDGIDQVHTPFLARVFVRDLVSDGYNNAWLAGQAYGTTGPSRGLVVAHWDGKTWHRVQLPAGIGAMGALSIPGHSSAWAVASAGFGVSQSLLHWDGVAWSTSYTPSPSLATHGRVPQAMTAASSGRRAWVAYTEASTDSGSNARHGPEPRTISAFYGGHKWRAVPLPAIARAYGLAKITMTDGDAWAITEGKNIGAVLYSSQGSGWCTQALPHQYHRACQPTGISAASPTYVIADTGFSSAPCHRSYAFVYDGHRWRALSSHSAV